MDPPTGSALIEGTGEDQGALVLYPDGRELAGQDRICARICARDGSGPAETGETGRGVGDRPRSIGRGQRH
jgi:hypothetical protein